MSKVVTIQAQQMWEYCHLTRRTEDSILAEMNQFGQEGWELVAVQTYKDMKGSTGWIAFLKRPSTGAAAAAGSQAAAPVVVRPTDAPKPGAAGQAAVDDGVFDLKVE